MIKKFGIIVSVFVGLFILGVGLFWLKGELKEKKAEVKEKIVALQKISVTQSVDYAGKSSSVSASLKAEVGTTALKLLQDSHKAQVKQYSFGAMVESIGGIEDAKNKYYWIYYVNGETAKVGADQYILKPNDSILWKLEKERPL